MAAKKKHTTPKAKAKGSKKKATPKAKAKDSGKKANNKKAKDAPTSSLTFPI
jgi:hypothetical protein